MDYALEDCRRQRQRQAQQHAEQDADGDADRRCDGDGTHSRLSFLGAPRGVGAQSAGLIGQVLIEHSPRENQHYPLWAIASDLRMLVLFLRGRAAREFGCADFDKSTSL